MISRAQNYHRQLVASASKFVRLCTQSARQFAPEDVAGLAALFSLASRGLCPSWLYESPGIEYFRELAGDRPIILDATKFGDRLTGLARRICTRDVLAALPSREILAQFQQEPLLKDPLFVGWVYQVFLCRPRKSVLEVPDHIDAQSVKAADVEVSDLPKLTQWFTPSWISEFLIDETVGSHLDASLDSNEDVVFCDPACGAGHILLEALKKLFDYQVNKKHAPPVVALSEIFEKQLYGFDIDAFVLELAGLSLYLAARDWSTDVVELPLPKLFWLSSDSDHVDGIGSLWLGVDDQKSSGVQAYGFDGVVALAELPGLGDFTAIAANPPYLSHRLMPPTVRQFVRENYGQSHYDLYAAFLELSLRLLGEDGRMAIICQQSFLSTQRYQNLRTHLQDKSICRSLVLLGSGVFEAKPGEKVSNAIYVAEKKGKLASVLPVKCWRILDNDLKELAASQGIKALPYSEADCDLGFAFWCPGDLSKLFTALPAMESESTGIVCTNGLFTCNNDLFVKLHFQVPEEEQDNYVAYDKGGGQKWYRKTPYMVQFANNGEAIRNYRAQRGQSRSLPGERFYFQQGITYSYIGTRGFKARLLSEKSVFDIASSAIFTQRSGEPDYLYYVLGFLNSSLARFLLGVLNPTVNFQIGDLRRLPFLDPPKEVLATVAHATKQAIVLAQELDSFDLLSPDYKGPAILRYSTDVKSKIDLKQAHFQYVEHLEDLNRKEADHQKLIDDQIFDLYEISPSIRAQVLSDFWVNGGTKKNQLAAIPSLKQSVAELVKFLDESPTRRWKNLSYDQLDRENLRAAMNVLIK
jgi:hypothetical protein